MYHSKLSPRQRRLMAVYAADLTNAPDEATCDDSARHCAYVERFAYHDPAEADRATFAFMEEARRLRLLSRADVLVLAFPTLVEACRDQQLAEIAAMGAGFWPRDVDGRSVWADRLDLSGKSKTFSFARQRWWGHVFAADDAPDH